MTLEREKFPSNYLTGNEIKDHIPFDHHCPQCGSGLNMYKHQCDLRRRSPKGKGCSKGCKNYGRVNADDPKFWTEEGSLRQKIVDEINKGTKRADVCKIFDITENKFDSTRKAAARVGKLNEEILNGKK